MPFGIDINLDDCTRYIAKLMADFGVTYTQAYQVALVKKTLDDGFEAKAVDDSAPRQLLEVPGVKVPDKKGEMKIKSAILGRWKKKYFYIKDNYELGYSSGPDAKEDGSYNLWGYKVQSMQFKPEGPRKGGPDWIPDEERPNCVKCNKQFSAVIWHHHCRNCGEVFCSDCAGYKASLTHFGYEKPQRVCEDCFAQLGRARGATFAVTQPKEEKADAGFHGVQLLHSTRTPYTFECESLAEKQAWIEALSECCKRSSLPINPDPVQAAAFESAFRRTNWNLGYWYSWRITGSEIEMISDLFARAVDQTIVRPAISNADPMIPANIKRMASTAINEQVIKLVRAAVEPGWKGIMGGISQSQATIVAAITPIVAPIGAARNDTVNKIKDKVNNVAMPVMEKAGKAAVGFVLEKICIPIIQAFSSMFSILNKQVTSNTNKIKDTKSLESYTTQEDREFRGWSGHLRTVHYAVHEISWELRKLQNSHPELKYFPVSKAFDALMDLIHNLVSKALYTFQKEVKDVSLEGIKSAWSSVLGKLLHDSLLDLEDLLVGVMKEVALGPVQEFVLQNEEIKAVTGAIDDLLPEMARAYLSISDMIDEIITKIVSENVTHLVRSSTDGVKEKISASMKALNV